MNNFQEKVSFIWSVADLLRGDYKQSEYGKVILPLTVLRRLDCVLEPTKQKVLDKAKSLPKKADEAMKDMMLCSAAGQSFYNLSKFTFQSLLGDQDHIAANLTNYIAGFTVQPWISTPTPRSVKPASGLGSRKTPPPFTGSPSTMLSKWGRDSSTGNSRTNRRGNKLTVPTTTCGPASSPCSLA